MAAQGLGEERARHGRVMQRGGVELHELDIGRGHAGAQRHGHAVAGRLGRVGGDREELAGAARGQDDVGGPHLDVVGPGTEGRQRGHADAAAALDDQVEREPALEHGAGRAVGGVDQGPFHLGARRRATGVHDAWPGVAALAGERQRAGGLAVELDAQRDQLVHAPGAFVDQNPHRLLVAQAGAGGERVGQVQVGRVLVAPQDRGDAPLSPARGRLGEHALGQDAQGRRPGEPDGGGQAGDAAAQDQDVEGTRRRAGPAAHAGSVRGADSSASKRADASSITRLRPSTCTTRGT